MRMLVVVNYESKVNSWGGKGKAGDRELHFLGGKTGEKFEWVGGERDRDREKMYDDKLIMTNIESERGLSLQGSSLLFPSLPLPLPLLSPINYSLACIFMCAWERDEEGSSPEEAMALEALASLCLGSASFLSANLSESSLSFSPFRRRRRSERRL